MGGVLLELRPGANAQGCRSLLTGISRSKLANFCPSNLAFLAIGRGQQLRLYERNLFDACEAPKSLQAAG